jgi:acyl carrier protein
MSEVQQAIHNKVKELARQLGKNASRLGYDEEIPATGLLDSAALMELVMWFETTYSLCIDQADLTLENLGTINAMADYLRRSRHRPGGDGE